MPVTLSRRRLLHSVALAAAAPIVPIGVRQAAAQATTQLNATTRVLEVDGKPAKVFGALQNNGTSGLFLDPGQRFNVQLVNKLNEPTILHWHGQTPPVAEDGVAITGEAKVIEAGSSQNYDFAARPGTYWMHSHQGLQEMQLLAGPLIVRRPEEAKEDAQEVTVILHDFTFKSPEEVLKEVAGSSMSGMGGMSGASGGQMAGMNMAGDSKSSGKPMAMNMSMGGNGPDLNDYDFDAYLANDRTLRDPEVVRTERNGRVRLRLINAGSSTIFWIELGATEGTLVAVDGEKVRPLRARRFPIAEAQRLDIMLDVPAGKVVPVLAQREGDKVRTGIILAAPGAQVGKVATQAAKASEAMGNSLEAQLVALEPLPARKVDRRHRVALSGSMSPYKWMINGRTWEDREPLKVTKGQRVELNFVNETPMGHPMHLHGHVFQVVELNGKALLGATRDTLQIPAKSTAKVVFDADNPGRWVIHCHNLLHMETGMITELVYEA